MSKTILTLTLLPLSAILLASDSASKGGSAAAVIAEIDGIKLTRAEFERRNASRLFQARNSYYEAERKAIEEYLDQYLLERQAEKEKTTVDQLIERHVTSKISGNPSDEALRFYYEGLDTKESFEEVRGKILDHVRQRRIAKAKAAYTESLRAQSSVVISLSAPRVQVSLNDAHVRGPKDAPVLLVEYADYECPYCQQIQPALDRIHAEYKGKVAFAYKDVPLPMHANAQKASEAAHCAGVQNKYWEYHDLLVSKKQLDLPRLKEIARELKLDVAAFDKCVDTGERAAVIKAHMAEAQSLGLQGTPSFFINGRFFSGALSYEKLREVIEEELSVFEQEKRTAKR